MMTFLTTIVGLFVVLSFGYILAQILLPDEEFFEQISIGFILGIGIFTFFWFLLNWAGISYSLLSGWILALGLNGIALIGQRFIKRKAKNKTIGLQNFITKFSILKKLNIIEKSFLLLILFLSITSFVQDLYWPIRYWDSLVLYDFRAKIFVQTGFMQSAIATGNFFGYPLFTSLAHTWVYFLGATNPSFIYSLLYICLLINFFFNIKKLKIGDTATLFLTAMVAISPRLFDHTQWAYTNLPYSIFTILGSIYLFMGIKNKKIGEFAISALLIGLSTWTRTAEPFWLSCIVIAIISSLWIKKWVWPFVYTILLGLIMLPWREFQALNNQGVVNVVGQVVTTSYDVTQNINASILGPVFSFFMTNVVQMYQAYFTLFAFIIIFKIVIKSKNWLFVALIMFDLAITFAGTMIFARYTTYWQEIPDSMSRMVMFMPVLIISLSGELLSELRNK